MPRVPAKPSALTSAPAAETAASSPRVRACSNLRLRQLGRLVTQHYDAVVQRETGLKTSQYSLLGHIRALQPVRPADLAAAMTLQPSTLSRNLQPVVAQGWVVVEPGEDGRSQQLRLTEAGQAKQAECRSAWKQAQASFHARMGAERVVQLHALLDECIALMQEPGHAPGQGAPAESD